MPTRADNALAVRENLDDLGISFYSSTDINDSLQDAYNKFCALTGCIVKSTHYPILSQPYWNLGASIPNYLYTVGLWNYGMNKWMEAKPRRFLDNIRWDWELWTGNPFYFCPIDFRRIVVAPSLPAPSGVVYLLYKAKAPIMSDATVPLIPNQIEHILEWYATADLLEQAKEYNKAAEYWAEWRRGINVANQNIHNPAQSDRMHAMAPWWEMPRFGPAGGSGLFVDNEIPTGTINSINTTFTLAGIPNPTASLCLFKNGQLLFEGEGYNLSGNTIVYESGYVPQTGDSHRAWYRIT